MKETKAWSSELQGVEKDVATHYFYSSDCESRDKLPFSELSTSRRRISLLSEHPVDVHERGLESHEYMRKKLSSHD